jgi:2-polyprenyl-3-methyl-5-hydroxy-6-metoxy-1,4-benzoquinol methylase
VRDNLDGYLSGFLRRRRIAAAKPYITGRVLDIGCGIGLVCDWVGESCYVGIEIDPGVLAFAKHHYPKARFVTPAEMDTIAGERFDTIVGLAVIEYLPNPLKFLQDAAKRLAPNGRIVLTTHNPALDWAHGLGARVGLFSLARYEKHQSLKGRRQLEAEVGAAGLMLTHYRRFLCGANQLAIIEARR